MKRIIIKPLITEKSMSYANSNKYTFEVHPDANKIEILLSVKELYKVEPLYVQILNVKGKNKSFRGRAGGRTKDRKKAIVTVKKGQKIKGFEIAEKSADKKEDKDKGKK